MGRGSSGALQAVSSLSRPPAALPGNQKPGAVLPQLTGGEASNNDNRVEKPIHIVSSKTVLDSSSVINRLARIPSAHARLR